MRFPGFVRRNWQLKVGCFLIAFVTWVGVVYAGNPPTTKVVSLAVPQSPSNIPAAYVLVHPVSNVLVRVGGDQNNLEALNTSELTVIVDWAAVRRAGTYSIPITITSSNPNIELISPPTSVQVDLDSFTSKSVPVTIQVTNPPPAGYESGAEQATPSTVVVYGPERELVGIEARVSVNLGAQKANYQQLLPVLVYSKGVRLNNVSVDHAVIGVSITITAYITTRVVAVIPKTEGNPSPGHYLTGIAYTPLTVVATGPQDLLNALDSVTTNPIDLTGAFGVYTVTVTLIAPAGVTLSQPRVTVTIEVASVPTPSPTPTPTPSPSP
ncbi:MAG TPA: CdaR family protein [Candidatus Saccharimonadales bacterium]|nr:CdaR family protein [Candidatus Saccharimonadales bacterium]